MLIYCILDLIQALRVIESINIDLRLIFAISKKNNNFEYLYFREKLN